MENDFLNNESCNMFTTSENKQVSDINPKNPFDNFMENEDYNSDYREIVPQIDIPGCVIPFEPSRYEKKKIRHFFNLAGGGVLLHFIFSSGIMVVLMLILKNIVMKKDGASSGEATRQYLLSLEKFFDSSSISMGINMIVLMACSIGIFLIGSKIANTKISSYFNTTGLTFKKIVIYFIISFFIRYVGNVVAILFEMIFSGVDMSVGSEIMSYQSTKTIVITAIYVCFVAPVTEELMYRGFVLKNLSRVSQRFGIMVSSLMFGLMHANVSQFIFAFIMGIFLSHITIKHNSIIPSMIVHALSNIFSFAVSYSGIMDDHFTAALVGFVMFGACIAGVVLYVKFHKNNRLPYSMPHQKLRNGVAVSSILLILPIAIYILLTVMNSFPQLFN